MCERLHSQKRTSNSAIKLYNNIYKCMAVIICLDVCQDEIKWHLSIKRLN